MENTEQHGRIMRVLHDFLAAAVFAREPSKLRNDRCQQLQHDRRADVGHDPERKNRAVLQRTAAEKVKQRRYASA